MSKKTITLPENPTLKECKKYFNKMNKRESLSAFEWSEMSRASSIMKGSFSSNNSGEYNPPFDEPTKKIYKRKENGMIEEVKNPRKDMPLFSGVFKYFPNALLEVSKVSVAGNKQHKNGEELKWDRSKSTDEADALARHLLQAGEIDDDGLRHTSKVAWRALALLEKELEIEKELNIK